MIDWKDNIDEAAILARQVLRTHPDVIDAYVVLAQTRDVPAEAIALLSEAVRVGDRARKVIDETEGVPDHSYGRYAHVRASGDLARRLWTDGGPDQRTAALRHARRGLRL